MTLKAKRARAEAIFSILNDAFPDVGTFLTHESPFQLLIAVILSAQCTDARVNMVTPGLFDQFGTPDLLANARLEDVRDCIRSVNFFNNKAKNIIATAQLLIDDYNGEVPGHLDDLVRFPGVGRKTANVVLGQAFDVPGITVDTHVKRLVKRWGLTREDDPVKVEKDLMKVWPKETWIDFSSITILHGRQTCKAQRPLCETCFLSSHCRQVGVN